MSDSLIRTIRQPDVRQFITDGRLVLLTPYRPDNGFSVGAAMGRNKIIYGSADFAVVVSSDFQKSGNWARGTEALKTDFCPVAVCSGAHVGARHTATLKPAAPPLSFT